MSEEQIKGAIRGLLKSLMAGDVTKALSLMTEDAVWVTPQGTFKGASAIKSYLTWISQVVKDYKITETGIGIIVQGNTGVIEHNLAGTTDGMKWEVLGMCIYEFKNDKIENLRTVYDRLAQAKQAAKGVIAKRAVTSVVNATEKGLH